MGQRTYLRALNPRSTFLKTKSDSLLRFYLLLSLKMNFFVLVRRNWSGLFAISLLTNLIFQYYSKLQNISICKICLCFTGGFNAFICSLLNTFNSYSLNFNYTLLELANTMHLTSRKVKFSIYFQHVKHTLHYPHYFSLIINTFRTKNLLVMFTKL